MVVIGTTQNRSENAFLLLKVLYSEGNQLNLFMNRFDLFSDEIAELDKSRWAIELFFKWMKQHLNIKKFYAQSQQGWHNQVYLEIIVYYLNVLAQLRTKNKRTYLQISRYLKDFYGSLRMCGFERLKIKACRNAGNPFLSY